MKKRNSKKSIPKTSSKSETHISFGPEAEAMGKLIQEALDARTEADLEAPYLSHSEAKKDYIKICSDTDQLAAYVRDGFGIDELVNLVSEEDNKAKKFLMILGLVRLLG